MTVTERAYDVEPSDLFAYLVDPETYPAWLVGTKRIRTVGATWPQPGSSFKHLVGFGPVAIADTTTSRSIEAPAMLELFVRARPLIEAVVRFDVTPTTNGCLLRMTETPAGAYQLVSPIMQPLIQARNERSLTRLGHVIASRPRSQA
jgi:uncharacterized protein YndB with AHSA1/START domain